MLSLSLSRILLKKLRKKTKIMGYLIIKKDKCISININSVNDLSVPEEEQYLCMEPIIDDNTWSFSIEHIKDDLYLFNGEKLILK